MNRLNPLNQTDGADRRRRGFTLVEITVAIGLFGFIMLGLAAIASISSRGGYTSKQRTIATYLATQMLETLCAGNIPADDANMLAFDGVDTSNTYPTGSIAAIWAEEIRTRLRNSDARGTIAVESNSPVAGKYRVTVEVFWPTRSGESSVTIVGVR